MAFFENIMLSISGLLSNKMRSLLTMLGIIIGISSVIGIVTVGNSLSNSVTSAMQGMGGNNIVLGVQERSDIPIEMQMMGAQVQSTRSPTEEDYITDEMLAAMRDSYSDEIEAITMTQSVGSGKAQDGRRYANLNVVGTNEDYRAANNLTMMNGRFLREKDLIGLKNVAVISNKAANNLFGKQDPLGQEIKVHFQQEVITYMVVGVYEHQSNPMMGFSMASDKDVTTDVYIPYSTAKKQTNGSDGYYFVTVMTKPGIDSAGFAKNLQNSMNAFYRNNEYFQCFAMSMQSVISQMNTIMGTLSTAVAVIAAISLIVGGVGVMNIMLVSITERTREIGTRKALGATNGSIRLQFIVESVIICLIGGIIGIICGILLGNVGAMLLGYPASPSFSIIVIAMTFSMLIGVFFGYYPANKAAKLDPIEALRYE